jgi:hypothetical protein
MDKRFHIWTQVHGAIHPEAPSSQQGAKDSGALSCPTIGGSRHVGPEGHHPHWRHAPYTGLAASLLLPPSFLHSPSSESSAAAGDLAV